MSGLRPARIGVIGSAALDRAGRLAEGSGIAALIQEAGAETSFAGLIDAGETGRNVKEMLDLAGVDTSRLAVSPTPPIALGDQIDVAGLFAMDALVIAVADVKLHRFLVDLPVHTAPNARLIGLLAHLAARPSPAALDIALLHDLVIVTGEEVAQLTGVENRSDALQELQRRMVGANLRSAAVLRAREDAVILTASERWEGHVQTFERLVARAVVTFARRDPWTHVFATDRAP